MSVAHTIRVLIVDDHEIIRTGITYSITAFPDLELVGEASSGQEALKLCRDTQPDVASFPLHFHTSINSSFPSLSFPFLLSP